MLSQSGHSGGEEKNLQRVPGIELRHFVGVKFLVGDPLLQDS